MPLGKSIRIFLADGSVTGIRHGEIVNWTGQAIACPRTRFPELRDWQEARKPGVYFLFGKDDDSGQDTVYIGEAEVVVDRLASHISGKDFWAEVIAFTSKDDNLTKGHVRYLESRLVQQAVAAKRYAVKNSASPTLPNLPRSDRDAMEEYLDAVRVLLGVLGHRVLEPLLASTPTPTPEPQPVANPANKPGNSQRPETALPFSAPVIATFRLNDSRLAAYATRTDEGLVVLEGTEAAASEKASLTGSNKALRARLLQSGVLSAASADILKFTRPQLFNSPSQAAAVLVGYSVNGRDAWRLPDGTTYGAYEERLLRLSSIIGQTQ